ncbi:MAG: hypothetical protein P4L96_10245 [Rhodoferax sp.]|nr:hypothetical protein [Rhodoferax sp.]
MPHQIRTTLRHEDTSEALYKERGSRYWTAAELLAPTWFVVETCIEISGVNEIRRWVTTSIREATQIQLGQAPFIWSQIFVCIRAPLSVRSATVFEVVDEAYQLLASGAYVYQLANGMSFKTGGEQLPVDNAAPEELTLVYARRR